MRAAWRAAISTWLGERENEVVRVQLKIVQGSDTTRARTELNEFTAEFSVSRKHRLGDLR